MGTDSQGNPVRNNDGPLKDYSPFEQTLIRGTLSGLAGGVSAALIRGVKVDTAQITVDAFGNAPGSAYLQESQANMADESSAETQRLLRQAGQGQHSALNDVGAVMLANAQRSSLGSGAPSDAPRVDGLTSSEYLARHRAAIDPYRFSRLNQLSHLWRIDSAGMNRDTAPAMSDVGFDSDIPDSLVLEAKARPRGNRDVYDNFNASHLRREGHYAQLLVNQRSAAWFRGFEDLGGSYSAHAGVVYREAGLVVANMAEVDQVRTGDGLRSTLSTAMLEAGLGPRALPSLADMGAVPILSENGKTVS